MAAIVKGHGADTDGEDTFVPQGTTVRMYTAENVDLSTDVALLALLDKAGDPGVAITGTIKNYTLYKQDDQFIAQWYALAGDSNLPIWWVGTNIPDQTRLCEDPNRKSDDPEAMTCRSQGVHTCSGVLGLVQDTDIAIVACRGSWVEGAQPGGATATKYDGAVTDRRAVVSEYLDKLNSGDEAQVKQAEDDIDQSPQEVVARLIVNISFAAWQKARWLKEYAKQNDLTQFFGQLESNKSALNDIMEWLNDIPSYGAAVDAVATNYASVFAQWLDRASAEVRNALITRPAIAKVHEDETLSAAGAMMNPPEQ